MFKSHEPKDMSNIFDHIAKEMEMNGANLEAICLAKSESEKYKKIIIKKPLDKNDSICYNKQ